MVFTDEVTRGLPEDEPGVDPALGVGGLDEVPDPLEAVETAAEHVVGRSKGEVRPDDRPEGGHARVLRVELDEAVAARFEKAGAALGVDDAEIRG